MKTNELQYQFLREELMGFVNRQDSYLFTAETIAIALWTIALTCNNEFVSLLPIVVLIPFAFRIYDLRYGVAFLSAYIKIVLENEKLDGWENVRDKYYVLNPLKKSEKFWRHIAKLTLPLFSVISCVVFWLLRIGNNENVFISLENGILLAVQVLFVALHFIIYFKSNSTTIKEKVIENWTELKKNYLKVED